jgi:predicted transcriptional regulator
MYESCCCLSTSARDVYDLLRQKANANRVKLSYRFLAERAGYCRTQTIRAVRELCDQGLIRKINHPNVKKGGFQSNEYHLVHNVKKGGFQSHEYHLVQISDKPPWIGNGVLWHEVTTLRVSIPFFEELS